MDRESSRLTALLAGLGTGAGLMFFLDPSRGRSRRSRAGDLGRSVWSHGRRTVTRTARFAWRRANDTVSRARTIFSDLPVSDVVLEARARARLGRLVSHPHALKIEADSGRLKVSGPILATEIGPLHSGLMRVRGVTEIIDDLDIHATPGKIPSLQGVSRPKRGTRKPIAPARTLDEISLYRRLHVDTPIEKAYRFWRDLESLPHFLGHIEDVESCGEGRYRWTLCETDGSPLSWEAEITRELPNQLLSWRSLPGSPIESSGMIHVEAHPQGGTRLHVRFTYRQTREDLPIEKLFGASPQSCFEADCRRVVEFLERGVPPQDTAERPAVGD